MSSNESTIGDDYISILRSSTYTRIRVLAVSWKGPHSPTSRWITVLGFPSKYLPGEDIIQHICRLIKVDRRYFRNCPVCHSVAILGHFSGEICMSCAEAAGTVF